jgi:hypothetical protein
LLNKINKILKMSLSKIIESVTNILGSIRAPFIPIPAIILACSIFKRPGLSPMMIATNIIKSQSDFGAPTGLLPDGSPNMMNSLIYSITQNIVTSMQQTMVVESVIPAGSMVITGTCVTPLGPGTLTATNATPTKAYGIPR